MNHAEFLANEFNLNTKYSENIIALIDEGNTLPFISRYRKEMHGSCDDQVLRAFADRLEYIRNLDERKNTVRKSIEEQGKLTDQISAALDKAKTLTEVEDIYRPFKPKRKTRASEAIAKGLQPLADLILKQSPEVKDITAEAVKYINTDKGIDTAELAIKGAQDIIAEIISDDANIRKALRQLFFDEGIIETALNKKDESVKEKLPTYEMYDKFTEPVKKIASHRVLAINRAENENCLKVKLTVPDERAAHIINFRYVKNAPTSPLVKEAASDSYDRLLFSSIEREVRTELFEKASEQAIKMFEANLKPLLMQPPLKNKVILGLDPAYRTGCKLAVIDATGKLLDIAVVYFTPPQSKTDEAKTLIKKLIDKHGVNVIAIGNGTASKESEIFIAEFIKQNPAKNLAYIIVNEAGASVYSASKEGAEEFPDLDVAQRSAISIARRLQDPLAELIKIDPKSIGVGQYQHDMPQKRLDSVLNGVVENCVNSVGVDLNTASYALLSYISGLSLATAKSIVEHRNKKGNFKSREDLKKVAKLGPKAFEQSAGFLRIHAGNCPFDNTAVHPESYTAAEKLLKIFKTSVGSPELKNIKDSIKNYGENRISMELNVGLPTLYDIAEELKKPGRDIRDDLTPPVLRSDIMGINDLKEGMELTGTVRNVIDFGAFVDIGVHQDGLVHISQIADRYIKHPSEVLKTGDIVKVRVLGVDKAKNRISLSMRKPQ